MEKKTKPRSSYTVEKSGTGDWMAARNRQMRKDPGCHQGLCLGP